MTLQVVCTFLLDMYFKMVSQTVESNNYPVTITQTVWKSVLNLWKTLHSHSIFVL